MRRVRPDGARVVTRMHAQDIAFAEVEPGEDEDFVTGAKVLRAVASFVP